MAKKLNFAVLGLGMGGHHCKAIIKAKNANLVAVCDIDEERLKKGEKQYKCKGYKSLAKMLKDPEIDVVNICTESGNHAKHGIMAARAGKHLIVEKPVDITPERIKPLRDAVKKEGVKCGCIFQSRMNNCNILIRRAIGKGKMGNLIGVHALLPWYRAQGYYEGAHGSWKGTWRLDGGGSLMNQGIHTVDLIQWLAGPVESVSGFYGVFNHKIQAEDQTVAILRFKNGALGTLATTTCSIPGRDQTLYMMGSKGSFLKYGGTLQCYEMDSPKQRKRMLDLFGEKKTDKGISSDPMAVSADGHMLIVEDLVRAVDKDRDPVITIESATHSVEIACAIFKSSRTGKAVKIKDVRK